MQVYVHYPYCTAKCTYCAFNKYLIPNSTKSLEQLLLKEAGNRKATTLYFGGGTPSLASPDFIGSMISQLNPQDQITLECNPTQLDKQKLLAFKQTGVNRVSLGIQSLDQKALELFGRDHSVNDALLMLDTALSLFDHVSADFIYGYPGHQLVDWERQLREITQMGIPHLSLYQLTLERGTKMFNQVKDKQLQMHDQETLADFFELTQQMTEMYDQYEVSSFALSKEFESTHNKGYWQGKTFLGVGPGAHGKLRDVKGSYRTYNILSPREWMEQVQERGHGIRKQTRLSPKDELLERIAYGTRQTEPFSTQDMVLDDKMLQWQEMGLLQFDKDWIKMTKKGLAVGDRIALELSYLQGS
ncbi:oxygen-independent coproporphyrinogen III oxidase [Gorgonomyces haynaldii]|nr:oxygen-independent coproporphyrinogen III oxidase [Gorgonomyces haynaldii]